MLTAGDLQALLKDGNNIVTTSSRVNENGTTERVISIEENFIKAVKNRKNDDDEDDDDSAEDNDDDDDDEDNLGTSNKVNLLSSSSVKSREVDSETESVCIIIVLIFYNQFMIYCLLCTMITFNLLSRKLDVV